MRSRFVGKNRFIILFFMLLCSMCIISMGIKSNVSSAKIKSGVWKYGDDFRWTYDTKTKVLVIKGNGWMNTEPFHDDDKTYAPGWRKYCFKAKKAIIKGNVKNVGNSCFSDFRKLREVILPESVEVIERYSFEDTGNINIINMPAGLKRIKSEAFWNSGIERIRLPKGIRKISDACFFGSKLKYIKLNEKLKKIGDGAFRGTNTLEHMRLSKDLISIGGAAFADTKIKTITIPKKVKKIGKFLFSRNNSLSRIIVKSHRIKSIGKNMFHYTKQNITIEVPKKKYKEYKKMFLKNPGNKNVKVVVGKSL